MALLASQMTSDVSLVAPDGDVIAKSIITAVKGKSIVTTTTQADLAAAITDVSIEDVIVGAPSIVITLLDPQWRILDSRLFDPDADGRLNQLEINYPQGSRHWWRSSQVSAAGAAHTIAVTFVPRIVDLLQHKFGPKKTARSTGHTRAEFIAGLVKEVDGEFYCSQTDITQLIVGESQKSTKPSTKQPAGKAHKTTGVSDANAAHLTCKGSPLSASQIAVANIALGECKKRKASKTVAVAMLYAAMSESSLAADPDTYSNGTGGAVGPWQAQGPHYNGGHDTQGMAVGWLTGGEDFQQGGGIACARNHPEYESWQIANAVEANAVWNASKTDSYRTYYAGGTAGGIAEATKIVESGGINGSASGSVETIQPYYFAVGGTDNPLESYWDAIQRLAQEVNWELFIDGPRVYYDSQMTLITQKIAAVIDRDDVEVVDWSYDWETRNIATNFSLTLMCDPWEFHSGDVFQLTGFGAASNGSTAKLPGRWLVTQIERGRADLSSVFTLAQPTAPKREPAPTTTSSSKNSGSGSSDPGTPKTAAAAYAAAKALSDLAVPYYKYSRDVTRPVTAHEPLDQGLDCSSSSTYILYKAGFPLPGSPKAAPVSGAYESWGDAGKGKEMTVWCNADHIFIEFYLQGEPHMQANTSPSSDRPGVPPGTGSRLFPWGGPGQSDADGGTFQARHWSGT